MGWGPVTSPGTPRNKNVSQKSVGWGLGPTLTVLHVFLFFANIIVDTAQLFAFRVPPRQRLHHLNVIITKEVLAAEN